MADSKGKSTAHTRKPTSIQPCKCPPTQSAAAAFQEGRYGKTNRVHNPTANGYACTVCQNVKGY